MFTHSPGPSGSSHSHSRAPHGSSGTSSRSYSMRPPTSGSRGGGHSFGRKPFGASRPQSSSSYRGGGSSRRPSFNRGGNKGQYIDVSKFINKAVITEKIEHFVP